jgi:hypothetical protein
MLRIGLFSMVLLVAVTSVQGEDYQEDFSSGIPGWVGGYDRGDYAHPDDSYYYYDPAWEALRVRQPNKNIDGDDHYFCHPIDYDGGSFLLSYDMYVEDTQYDATLAFGLSSAPNDAWSSGPDPSHYRAYFGESDAGPGFRSEGCASDVEFEQAVWPYDSEGHWWHHELAYDADAQTMHTLVYRADDPSIVLSDVTFAPGAPFGADMDWLVLSDNRRHHYPSTGSLTYGIGYVDNISFVPEPSTLSLLALAGVAMVRRRR